MRDISTDVRAECEEIYAFVSSLDASDWQRKTVFYDWTIYDEVLHMHFLDLLGLMSLTDTETFLEIVKRVTRESKMPDYSFRTFTNEVMGQIEVAELLSRWRETYLRMCNVFDDSDPGLRMKWFGPDMSIKSFATARQMEVWAHGQDIYDLYKLRRTNASRLKNIALLGVRTYGWSFVNRGLEVPKPEPFIALEGPSGEVWEWNDPTSPQSVRGKAEDFCLVVTQRRNVRDTTLRCEGDGAKQWLQIAQCFAGPPADGPAPGVRVVDYGHAQ